MEKVRVMVVDDSAFMRKVISDILLTDSQIEVIGTARNGVDAWEKIKKNKPDVITLDVEMPEMDGLQLLEKLMQENPLPVVMLSTLTRDGTDATIKALSLGAVDFIPKPSGSISLDINKVKEDLISKVKIAAKSIPHRTKLVINKPVFIKTESNKNVAPPIKIVEKNVEKIIAIGTSTGGPRALQEVLPKLPADLSAAVLVVQHMPKGFTHSLAQRLNQQGKLRVKEAQEGDKLENGLALLAPGGLHMVMEKNGTVSLNLEPPVQGVRPAVDVLFKSIAQNFTGKVISVIMTGMGKDGTEGVTALKALGTKTIAEDQSTCVVYGMPKSVVDKGLADKVVPLSQIAEEIVKMV